MAVFWSCCMRQETRSFLHVSAEITPWYGLGIYHTIVCLSTTCETVTFSGTQVLLYLIMLEKETAHYGICFPYLQDSI